MYIVTQNVDYLSWSKAIPNWFFHETVFGTTKSPNKNYDRAEVSNTGVLHLWHSRYDDVKHHYIASGDTMSNLRNAGYDEQTIVAWCLEHAHISRIDIAITSQREDGKLHGFNPHHLAWAVRDGRLKSRMQPAKDIVNEMKTETKYIGNRKTRKRLFRAYDKGLDSGGEAGRLIRYELETRQGTKTIAREVVRGTAYNTIIKRYVDFPDVAIWGEIMNAEIASIIQEKTTLTPSEAAKEKSKSRWAWLMRSIVPVIGKTLREDEKLGIARMENQNFTDFIRAIMSEFDE